MPTSKYFSTLAKIYFILMISLLHLTIPQIRNSLTVVFSKAFIAPSIIPFSLWGMYFSVRNSTGLSEPEQGQGGGHALSEINPISTREADYASTFSPLPRIFRSSYGPAQSSTDELILQSEFGSWSVCTNWSLVCSSPDSWNIHKLLCLECLCSCSRACLLAKSCYCHN